MNQSKEARERQMAVIRPGDFLQILKCHRPLQKLKKKAIERFAVISQVISSDIEINYELFDSYATETAQFQIIVDLMCQ